MMTTHPSAHNPNRDGRDINVGVEPPPYTETPTYSAPRQLTWAHATGHHDDHQLQPTPSRQAQAHKPRSFLEPLELPSPFQKPPKSRVSNFREGLKEGGRGAWAEVREGLKGPVGLTYYWAKEGGPLGALGGLGYGATILALCPLSASIAFLNHSSRGAIRSVRAAKQRRSNRPLLTASNNAQAGPSSSSSPPPSSRSLAIPRTSTMGSTVTSRSRRRGLLSRVTSVVSQRRGRASSEGGGEADEEGEGQVPDRRGITPFPILRHSDSRSEPPPPPALPEMTGRGKGRERPLTQLELDMKWGSDTAGEGSSRLGEGSRTRRGEENDLSQMEMDMKWGIPSMDQQRGLEGPSQVEMDTKCGLIDNLPPLAPPIWDHNGAGPSGTPQLERDIKWPILSPSSDNLSASRALPTPPNKLNTSTEVQSHPQPLDSAHPSDHTRSSETHARSYETGMTSLESRAQRDEPTALEMELKWRKEFARAGLGYSTVPTGEVEGDIGRGRRLSL